MYDMKKPLDCAIILKQNTEEAYAIRRLSILCCSLFYVTAQIFTERQ